MAHRILDRPNGITLSSGIGQVRINVEGSYVDVQLIATGDIVILSERYYALAGQVTLHDLASLIETDMRMSGHIFASYTFRVYTDSITNKADSVIFNILYCDRFTVCTDIEIFLKENFLSTLRHRRVADSSTTTLFFFAFQGESLAYHIRYVARKIENGSIYRNTFTLGSGITAAQGIRQINVSVDSIVADAAAKASVRKRDIEIVSFTVYCGQRYINCYVDRSLPNTIDNFAFRNCFNVWDVAVLPLITTAKTEVDRSTAVINGGSQFYDQSVNKTYEVTAGPLTANEAAWIDQLFTSYEVFRFEPNDCDDTEPFLMRHILITDMSCEMSDSDEKPNMVRFTWRYTDNRPIVRFSASRGIFTSPFDYRYS